MDIERVRIAILLTQLLSQTRLTLNAFRTPSLVCWLRSRPKSRRTPRISFLYPILMQLLHNLPPLPPHSLHPLIIPIQCPNRHQISF